MKPTCPRCHGFLFIEVDIHGLTVRCLNCGMTRDRNVGVPDEAQTDGKRRRKPSSQGVRL